MKLEEQVNSWKVARRDLTTIVGISGLLGALFLGQTMYRDNKREERIETRPRDIVYNATVVRVAGRINLRNCYFSENIGENLLYNSEVLRLYNERARELNPGKKEWEYEKLPDLDKDGNGCKY